MQRGPLMCIVGFIGLLAAALTLIGCAPDGSDAPTQHSAEGLKAELAVNTNCATVTSLSASALSANVGGVVQLAGAGVDSSGSSDNLQLFWAVTAGPGSGTLGSAS